MQSKFFATIVVLMILTFSIVGIFAFDQMEHGRNHTCPVANLPNLICPSGDDSIAIITHHLFGIKILSQAIPGIDINIMTFLFFSILLGIFIFWLEPESRDKSLNRIFLYRIYYWCRNNLYNNRQGQVLRWVALCNKQDLYASRWVHGMI